MTTISTQTTVGQLVADRPARSRLFEKLGIDYCCGGKKTLAEAAAGKGLDAQTLVQVLLAADVGDSAAPGVDAAKMSMTELCDHIESTHHAYLKEELPRLEMLVTKVANAHGPNHPYVVEVRDVFVALKAEMLMHMMKEEKILFPMIRQLDANEGAGDFHCGSIANPISVMVAEHEGAGSALERIRQVTGDYAIPADACNTFRATFDALQHLEHDLHQHIHKENNILFPRAIAAEKNAATCAAV